MKEASEKKVLSLAEFSLEREKLRRDGKKVAYCHGVFDLLHPGHIAHLEEAKSIADVLVVSITAAPYVNRGPGRPYFSDELRMQSLAALNCTDYILLAEEPTAMGMLETVQPDFYVKGSEYAKAEDDVTGNINKEIQQVRRFGGDVYFSGGIVFSSTQLLNRHFDVFTPEVKTFAKDFSQRYSIDSIRNIIEQMANTKVLVVGDIIIDEYVFCKICGLTSKDRAFSAVYDREEQYMGGTLAVARHIAGFSEKVAVCSMMGAEASIHSRLLNELSSSMLLNLHFDAKFPTVVKRRYVERHGRRNEYEKMFSMNYLGRNTEVEQVDRTPFYQRLEREVPEYDVVVVTDYGHGLLDQTAMDIIQDKAKFLCLNCQTNSTNFGTNLITKYHRADMFAVDERELRLALSDSRGEPAALLHELVKHFGGKASWATLGSSGSIAYGTTKELVQTPALTLTVQDTVGAGDAFFALAGLAAYQGVPVEVSSFIGNVAGALAANILGNSQSVEKGAFLKFATTLLKF